MRIETIKVSPAVAESFLSKNTSNRNVSRSRVSAYASDMNNGRWQVCPQPIIFSTEGELMDGQHRLLAVVASGKTIEMVVMFDAPVESKDVIDSGKARSVGDALKIDGVPAANHIAAIAKKIVSHTKGSSSIISSDKKGGSAAFGIDAASKAEVLEYSRKNIAALEDLYHSARAIYEKTNLNLLSASDIAFLLFALNPNEMAHEFVSRVVTGIGLEEKTPELAMRRMVERVRIKRDLPLSSSELSQYFFVAFEKFSKGEPCEILRLPKRGK